MNNYLMQTRHLPPNLQETVNTFINSILDLASRANSNMDSSFIGGTSYSSQSGYTNSFASAAANLSR